MKRKYVSMFLVPVLLLTASPTFADDPPPDDSDGHNSIAEACFVIVIGGIVAVGLWKICKSIPDPGDIPHPQAPPVTNPPPVINPTNAPPTNKPPWYKHLTMNLSRDNVAHYNIAQHGYQDAQGRTYESLVQYQIQSSTNCVDWRTELTATGWLSSGAALFAYYSNGVPLQTTYSTEYGQTNYVPWSFGDGNESVKVFRLLSVH